MSHTKRLIELAEQQRDTALKITIKADVIRECAFHEGCYYAGGCDPEEAYRIGSSMFSKNELEDLFETRREMTDTIQEVINENSAVDECQWCAKIRDED